MVALEPGAGPNEVVGIVDPTAFTGGQACLEVYQDMGQSACTCLDLTYPPPVVTKAESTPLMCPPGLGTELLVTWQSAEGKPFAKYDVEVDGIAVNGAPLLPAGAVTEQYTVANVMPGRHEVRVVGHRAGILRYASLPVAVDITDQCIALTSVGPRGAGGMQLAWVPTRGRLFDGYSVYRAGEAQPLVDTTETSYLDAHPPAAPACYYVVGHLVGEPDCCSLQVCEGRVNEPPVANVAALPSTALMLERGRARVVLDGGGSRDPDDYPRHGLAYAWLLIDGPVEGFVRRNLGEPTIELTFVMAGMWTFRLTVDDGGASDEAFATIVVGLGELFQRGDTNADQNVNIADPIALLGHLFGGDAAPSCPDAADANDDGRLNIADAITILSHLFACGGGLPAPFGRCGVDLTDDALPGCEYLPCAR
jgi:hypothetical protein